MRETGGSWRAELGEIQDRAPRLVGDVLRVVRERGPVSAGVVERELGCTGRRGGGTWWDRSDVKRACELLFATGQLTAGTRRGFERCYDVPERVLPADVLDREVDDATAFRELVDRAGSALGVATAADLRDYYRLRPEQAGSAIDALVEHGTLEPIEVRGWRQRAYWHVDTWNSHRATKPVSGRALLTPFDPLIWHRPRAERLFGFRYCLEIYVPAAQRKHGYYVFPFLLDGRLRARVDLKADRERGMLLVRAAFVEPEQHEAYVAGQLAAELREMAVWLGLSDVHIGTRGDLVVQLAREFRGTAN